MFEDGQVAGTIAVHALTGIPRERWPEMMVGALMDRDVPRIAPSADLQEALRILLSPAHPHMVLVVTDQELAGVLTKSDILSALGTHDGEPPSTHAPGEWR